MSNRFELKRTSDGLFMKIRSESIERLFRAISQDSHNPIAFGAATVFDAWYNNATEKFIRSVSDMFTTQFSASRGDKDAVLPTFRNPVPFQNNTVGLHPLMARGLGEGKEFQVVGMFSSDTARKITLGFQKAMDYFINDAAKTKTYTFEIMEKDKEKPAETEFLEFTNP